MGINKAADKSNIFKLGVIIASFLLLCVPCALGYKMQGRQIKAVDENRTLDAWPQGSITQIVTSDGSYCTAIENYFNDRFGLRDLMIRTKNQIQYSVFGITPGVYVGEDGYLSYESIVSKVQISNERMSEEDLEGMVTSFEGVADYLDEQGIAFFFLLAPQKNEVFPERCTSFPVQRPTPNNYEKLCALIQENDTVADHFIDAETILREAEENYPTFYKTDFHWNSYGATVVYTEAVNACAAYDGLSAVFGPEDYSVIEQEGFLGSQLNDMPLLQSWPSETNYATLKNTDITIENVTDGTEPNYAQGHYVNSDENAPLGSVLLIGDSYTWYMISANSGILDCFREVYWVHVGTMANSLTNYADLVDYVILEQVESGPESSILSLKDNIDTLYTE
jgi:alginate O-acetyltransferase complex protein AlgJ